MKSLVVAALMCACVGAAFAGPNAGGVLVAHNPGITYCLDGGQTPICGDSDPASCEEMVTRIDGCYAPGWDIIRPIKIYAAFPESSPRLLGLEWGIHYDPARLWITGFGMCGDFELNDSQWPASDTGSSVTYNCVQTSPVIPVYWFAACLPDGAGTSALLQLRDHPTYGGYFGDDTVPAVLDPIAGYGAMGFDMPGILICGTASAPEPPISSESWGGIKNLYR